MDKNLFYRRFARRRSEISELKSECKVSAALLSLAMCLFFFQDKYFCMLKKKKTTQACKWSNLFTLTFESNLMEVAAPSRRSLSNCFHLAALFFHSHVIVPPSYIPFPRRPSYEAPDSKRLSNLCISGKV